MSDTPAALATRVSARRRRPYRYRKANSVAPKMSRCTPAERPPQHVLFARDQRVAIESVRYAGRLQLGDPDAGRSSFDRLSADQQAAIRGAPVKAGA